MVQLNDLSATQCFAFVICLIHKLRVKTVQVLTIFSATGAKVPTADSQSGLKTMHEHASSQQPIKTNKGVQSGTWIIPNGPFFLSL